MGRFLLPVFVLASLPTPGASSDDIERLPIELWHSLARADITSRGGREYETTMTSYLLRRRIFEKCSSYGLPSADFHMYFEIDQHGEVTDYFLQENTREADCYETELRKGMLPRPPFSPFYFHIRVVRRP